MAATAHSDPCAILMRKIGYSVGLEYTLERVCNLEALYLQNRDVTAPSWRELVTGKDHWNLKSDNITDVFHSLRLIQRTTGDILVLENLDAMAIASTMLEEDEHKEAARKFLLLWAILANDGEIFVNLLLANFDSTKIEKQLIKMIQCKRAHARDCPLGKKISAKRINRIIMIERQGNNKGSAGAGKSVVSLKRTDPLQPEIVGKISCSETDGISDDYFRKVPPRRKAWACSLGLWKDDALTSAGERFVKKLTKIGYIDDEGLFTYWPMNYELIRAGFRPDLMIMGKRPKSLWECLVDFGVAYAGLQVKTPSDEDADDSVTLIGEMMKTFRTLHVRKSMLRRELPITVAYPVAIACACAKRVPVLNLPAAIKAEKKGELRRLVFRQSRHTGGALSVKRQ